MKEKLSLLLFFQWIIAAIAILTCVTSAAEYEQIAQTPQTGRGVCIDMVQNKNIFYAINEGENSLQILENNLWELKVLKRIDLTDDYGHHLVLKDNTLYIAQSNGIRLVDVTQPMEPVFGDLWKFDFPYTTTNSTQFFNPNTQRYEQKQTVIEDTTNNTLDFKRRGDILFIATGMAGVVAVDIADPAHPQELGRYDVSGFYPYHLELSSDGNTAYIGCLFTQVHILDVSDPTNLRPLWNDKSFFANENHAVQEMKLIDNKLYVTHKHKNLTGFSNVTVVNVDNPSEPYIVQDTPLTGYDFTHFFPGKRSDGIGGWAYFSITKNVQIGERTTEKTSTYANSFMMSPEDLLVPQREIIPVDGCSLAVAIYGNYAYVADRAAGVRILDISVPEKTVELAILPIKTYAWNLKVQDGRLYVAGDEEGFLAYSLENPANPTKIMEYCSPHALYGTYYAFVTDFIVEGHIAYLVECIAVPLYDIYLGILDVVDISDPSNPQCITAGAEEMVLPTIAKYGDTVMLMDTGFYVSFDVSFLHSSAYDDLFYKGTFTIPDGYSDKIVIPEATAPIGYISAGKRGILAVDFSDPRNTGSYTTNYVSQEVTTVGELNLPGYSCGVSAQGDKLLVGSYYDGFSIVDISNRYAPTLIENYPLFGMTRTAAMSVDEKVILTASSEIGSYVFRKVEEPPVPTEIYIIGIDFLADDSLELTITEGVKNYTIEYSQNLKDWSHCASAVIDANRVIIPKSALSADRCYYRVSAKNN